MPYAILKITDGTTSIDLLGETDGFMLREWTPAIPELKGGGISTGSPLSDGSALVIGAFDDTFENFDMVASGHDMDDLIYHLQNLRRLLQKGRDYWITQWHNQPVWIEARGSQETNTRYAIIKDWLLQTDDNPYAQPMYSSCRHSIADDLALTIKRGHWQNTVPGTGECVEISATQKFNVLGSDTSEPTAGNMDAYVNTATGIIFTSQNNLRFGAGTSSGFQYHAGIFFPSVNIPNGARILSAYIRFVAQASHSGALAVGIYGERNATPSVFTTYANFRSRQKTSHKVIWTPPIWYAGNEYDTPSLVDVVQEIIDLPNWLNGGDMVFFIDPTFGSEWQTGYRTAASFEHTSYAAPQLIFEWDNEDTVYGREATCAPEVYVANKHNMAQLTNIHIYDASSEWSGNLLGTYPYDLFPAAPVVGDAVYFGISSAVDDSGPFSSLIFDIITTQEGITDLVWQYWNGAWENLIVQDNTEDDSGEAFTVLGVNGVHWTQPEDWVENDPGIGITGYWVRCAITGVISQSPSASTSPSVSRSVSRSISASRSLSPSASLSISPSRSISRSPSASRSPSGSASRSASRSTSKSASISPSSSVSSSPSPSAGALTPPTQGNRDVYTVVKPYVDIDSAQVPGDIPALARAIVHNNSWSTTDKMITKIWMALRSNSRGENFTPYINISDEQNHDDITVGGTSFTTSPIAATGRVAIWNPVGEDASYGTRAFVSIGQTLIQEYIGMFHVFLRAQQIGGSPGDMSVKIQIYTGSSSAFFESEGLPTTMQDDGFELFYFGLVQIPQGMDNFRVDDLGSILMNILVSNTNDITPGDFYMHDIILMPTDEWIGQFYMGSTTQSRHLGDNRMLDISSFTNPKRELFANLQQDDNLRTALETWVNVAPAPFTLQANTDQRLFFLFESLNIGQDPYCPHEIHPFIEVKAAARYFSMRGRR